jgi:flavodoxin
MGERPSVYRTRGARGEPEPRFPQDRNRSSKPAGDRSPALRYAEGIKMRPSAFLLLLMAPVASTSPAHAQTAAPAGKVLVVYFSHSGNTAVIARMIQEATGGDAFEIAPVASYPTDYNAVVDQAKKELNANFRPRIKSTGPDLAAYGTIFVGSPNWWSTIAPPVMTFLEANNFAGKTIVPFITHEGSRLGKSVQDVKRLCPSATVLPGQPFRGSEVKDAREDVRRWLSGMKLLK